VRAVVAEPTVWSVAVILGGLRARVPVVSVSPDAGPTERVHALTASDRGPNLGEARLLLSGSAALPSTVFQMIASMTGIEPVERYGMTETLIT
jgi:acyl-CoA synthetase (AMP-forming)/AMP-acid ligase II